MTLDLKDIFNAEEHLNQDMVRAILSAIKDNYKDESEYLKFKQAVDNLQKLGMDEATSIKSAFATLSTLGLSKEKVLSSIRYYDVILTKEKEKFAQALKYQIAAQVDKPKLEIDKCDKEISLRLQTIEKLQQEIEAIKIKKESLPAEIATAEAKIIKTRDEFTTVYEHFAKGFDNDKILIDQLG